MCGLVTIHYEKQISEKVKSFSKMFYQFHIVAQMEKVF